MLYFSFSARVLIPPASTGTPMSLIWPVELTNWLADLVAHVDEWGITAGAGVLYIAGMGALFPLSTKGE